MNERLKRMFGIDPEMELIVDKDIVTGSYHTPVKGLFSGGNKFSTSTVTSALTFNYNPIHGSKADDKEI